MNTVLIIVTLLEVLLLVVVLAGYLLAIASKLHRISRTLGLVTFGVRAIESQTKPIGSALSDVNAALEQVARALQDVVGDGEPGAVAASAARPETSEPDEGTRPGPVDP